jgi:antirestriction protein ArdC
MTENTKDLYALVTARIVADLEKGVRPWQQPWKGGNVSLPVRANGIRYRGINILLLWIEAVTKGYASPVWLTYEQAKAEGGHVRRGERGTMIVFGTSRNISETNDKGEQTERKIPVLRHYTVFNVEQVEELPSERYPQLPQPSAGLTRIEQADAFVRATGAAIKHGGTSAHYTLSSDRIQMPPFERFDDKEAYYATLLHELTHWTRHKSRLARDFGQKKRGDHGYATEELVAELGAAFLCAELEITPAIREDHAAYLSHWLQCMKDDNRAIFRAAAHAQKAADFLKSLQPKPHEAQSEEPSESCVTTAHETAPEPPESHSSPRVPALHPAPT